MDADLGPPRGVADALLASGRDEDVAIVEAGRRYTYAELRAAVERLASQLAALGLPHEPRIGVLGPNSFFWVASYLAALKLGVAVPLSDKLAGDELRAQADWVDCVALMMDQRLVRRVGAAFGTRPVITQAQLEQSDGVPWPGRIVDEAADAVLILTSGTTSEPKAVRLTHTNLLANTRSIVSYLRLEPSDRMLVILPLHYCYGASLLHTHLAVGASLVFCNTFAFPQTAVDLVDRERCTGFAGVPSTFQLLMRASSYPHHRLPTLRKVQQAGGRLAPSMIEEVAAAQPHSQFFVMYGQTEATARLSYLPPEFLHEKLGSVGRGVPGVDLQVVDEAGRPAPVGQIGEIVARGASISPGYYNDPVGTAAKFAGGALRTGDLATVDDDGFIYIVGRSGDFIKSWGHRVSSPQVEAAGLQLPGVTEAAAVGLPDDAAGEAIVLAVTLAPGHALDATMARARLSQLLPKHAVPESVHVLDAFPLNASGKVSKRALRELLEQDGGQVQ